MSNPKKWVGFDDACVTTLALDDPLLYYSCPQDFTAYCGFDVLAHGSEPYVSRIDFDASMGNAYHAIELVGRYYRLLRASLGADRMRELWSARPFEVAELMVAPESRGAGLGSRLLSDLCPVNAPSWLATHPDAPAAGLYRGLGWEQLGGTTTHGDLPLIFFARPTRTRPSTRSPRAQMMIEFPPDVDQHVRHRDV